MYRQYSSEILDAGLITLEVVDYGESSGWSGTLEQLKNMQDILKKHNIIYVDDIHGTWKKKNGLYHL